METSCTGCSNLVPVNNNNGTMSYQCKLNSTVDNTKGRPISYDCKKHATKLVESK